MKSAIHFCNGPQYINHKPDDRHTCMVNWLTWGLSAKFTQKRKKKKIEVEVKKEY